MVAGQPSPLDLKVNRNGQLLNFRLGRVRESALAALSNQKYAVVPWFPTGKMVVVVPRDETPEELGALRTREIERGESEGFKLVGGRWVPRATSDSAIRELAQIPPERRVATLRFYAPHYGAGFSALLLRNPQELVVETIAPASPAYRAGLLPGDRLVRVQGRTISALHQTEITDLFVGHDGPPVQVHLGISRGGPELDLTLETEPARAALRGISTPPGASRRTLHRLPSANVIGVEVADADHPRQVVVNGVDYPSPAFDAGVHVGDVILAVNKTPIERIPQGDLADLLYPAGPSHVLVKVLRLGSTLEFRLNSRTQAEAQAAIGRRMTKDGPASAQCAETETPNR